MFTSLITQKKFLGEGNDWLTCFADFYNFCEDSSGLKINFKGFKPQTYFEIENKGKPSVFLHGEITFDISQMINQVV